MPGIYTDGRVDQCKVDNLLDDTIGQYVAVAKVIGWEQGIEPLRQKLHALTDALVDAARSEAALLDSHFDCGPGFSTSDGSADYAERA
jgi:hypothetical protein